MARSKTAPGPARSFNNIPTDYLGHHYDSKREAAYAAELELRRRAGDIRSWEPHVSIPLDVEGTRVCVYIADFRIWSKSNDVELVDVKGGPVTAVFKLKMKLLAALYPEITVRIVR
jgi:hypothetical protein